jgi:hypothetical protein
MDKKQLRTHVKTYLQTKLDEPVFSDAVSLVKISEKISENYDLSGEEKIILEMAAWFRSVPELASAFLTSENTEASVFEKIISLINIEAKPGDSLQMIILDAASYHYGTKGFKKQNERQRLAAGVGKQEWLTKTISEIKAHKYYTDYGLSKLEMPKQVRIEKLEAELTAVINATKKDRPERSIETMFKISASNHQHLSSMADNKAHILITVNSIILSILISVLLRKLDEDSYLAYPTFVLLAVSVVSITISIIAIKPVVRDNTGQPTGSGQKNPNLLFFGSVSTLKLKEFTERILGTMDDKDTLYLMLIRNAYLHSIVLGRKSRLLKTAYIIFMYGLIISVVAFIAVSIVHNPRSSVSIPQTPLSHLSLKAK